MRELKKLVVLVYEEVKYYLGILKMASCKEIQ